MAIAAAAIVILTVGALRLMRSCRGTLAQTEAWLAQSQQELREAAGELRRLTAQSNRLLLDVEHKLEALDACFEAAGRTGESAGRLARSVQTVAETVEETVLEARRAVHSRQNTANELMEFASTGAALWHRLQAFRRRNAERKAASCADQTKEV